MTTGPVPGEGRPSHGNLRSTRAVQSDGLVRAKLRSDVVTSFLIFMVCMGLVPAAPAAQEAPPQETDLRIQISPAVIEKLLAAAVPYDLTLDVGLFEEVIRLSEPRNLEFFAGGIRLEMLATGSPIGFSATIHPVIRLERGAGSRQYLVRVESLPVDLGLAGTFDLALAIPPFPIKTLSEFFLSSPDKEIPMEMEILQIQVDRQGIELLMRTRFPSGDPTAGP